MESSHPTYQEGTPEMITGQLVAEKVETVRNDGTTRLGAVIRKRLARLPEERFSRPGPYLRYPFFAALRGPRPESMLQSRWLFGRGAVASSWFPQPQAEPDGIFGRPPRHRGTLGGCNYSRPAGSLRCSRSLLLGTPYLSSEIPTIPTEHSR